MFGHFAKTILIIGLLLFSTNLYAQENYLTFEDTWSPAHEEIATSRALAMGRAFISIAEGNSAYLYNPAGVAQTMSYSLGIDSEFNPTGNTMAFGASIVDAATSALCAQVGFTFHRYESRQLWEDGGTNPDLDWLQNDSSTPDTAPPFLFDRNSDGQLREPMTNYTPLDLANDKVSDFRRMFGVYKKSVVNRYVPRLSLAGAIGKYFFLGGTAKYLYAERPGRHSVNAANVDIGMLVKTDFGLRLGVVGYNLINTSYDNWPLKLGAGLGYSFEDQLYIAADVLVMFDVYHEKERPADPEVRYPDGTRLAYRIGLEYVVAGMVALRAGYEYDGTIGGDHNVSGGIAYKDPDWAIHLSYAGSTNDTDKMLMSVGLSVNF